MKRIFTGLVLAGLLSACASTAPFEQTGAAPAPAAAPDASAYAGADVAGIAACVRDNATEGELAMMALGDERSQTVTAEVLGRPATQDCLRANNVALPTS